MAFSFVRCSVANCNVTSNIGEYDSMALRIGFSKCCKHLEAHSDEVTARIDYSTKQLDERLITVIFYNIGLSKDGQIEQLDAICSTTGHTFCSIIKTRLRANTSSTLKNIPSDLYNALSEDPKVAMERFIQWIKMTHCMNMNTSNRDFGNVVLTAHFGSCHDHVLLLRTMISWGVEAPKVRLADSLALLEAIKGRVKHADEHHEEHHDIASLVGKYAPCLQRGPQCKTLRAIVMAEFPRTEAACYAFSTSWTEFMERTGLNELEFGHLRHTHYPMYEGAIICEESARLIGWRVGGKEIRAWNALDDGFAA